MRTGLHVMIYGILTSNVGWGLYSQLEKAIPFRDKHKENFEKFSLTFAPDVVEKWMKMVEDWDKDMTKPNPYEDPALSKFLT